MRPGRTSLSCWRLKALSRLAGGVSAPAFFHRHNPTRCVIQYARGTPSSRQSWAWTIPTGPFGVSKRDRVFTGRFGESGEKKIGTGRGMLTADPLPSGLGDKTLARLISQIGAGHRPAVLGAPPAPSLSFSSAISASTPPFFFISRPETSASLLVPRACLRLFY